MKNNLFDLSGKVAVVTGATGLLGQNHCKCLAEYGANIIVTDIDFSKCKSIADKLNTISFPFKADITIKEDIIALRDFCVEKFGKIDVLVNNAAINDKFENPIALKEVSKFENYPLELWQSSIDVNLTGTFLCCQIIGTEMARRCRGSIINIASTYGIVAPDQSLYKDNDGEQTFYKTASYPVTKAGVLSLTKYLASYWGNSGVRVNALSPGGVENNQSPFFISQYSNRTPLSRMANQSDFKGGIVFLASDASAYMTGSNLIIDGGYTIW